MIYVIPDEVMTGTIVRFSVIREAPGIHQGSFDGVENRFDEWGETWGQIWGNGPVIRSQRFSGGPLPRVLQPVATQVGFELAEVFGQFCGPGHALTGMFRVFQGEDFGVQGLPRKINGPVGGVLSAPTRMICAVTDQG